MYKRTSETKRVRSGEPLGLIIKSWKPRTDPAQAKARKYLIEWLIHPGSPTWYRVEDLVLVSSAR
jgi:hypothetical protein